MTVEIIYLKDNQINYICSVMSWLFRKLLRGGMHLFSWFVIPYSRLVNSRIPQEKIPSMKNHLLRIPATKLAYMIRTKQVNS